MTGLFITFEGIEGVGKTTQINLLSDYLQSQNIPFIVTKEPGGTKNIGQKIRELLLDNDTKFSSFYSELLLFYVDRLENLTQLVLPALSEDKVVLCDRFIDSTYAYQVGGRGVDPAVVEQLNQLVKRLPDITLLFDGDPKKGIERAEKRAALNRFEEEKMAFHHKIRAAYLDKANATPNRIKVLSVDERTPDEIFEDVLAHIEPLLKS